jgi:hypothetical protein
MKGAITSALGAAASKLGWQESVYMGVRDHNNTNASVPPPPPGHPPPPAPPPPPPPPPPRHHSRPGRHPAPSHHHRHPPGRPGPRLPVAVLAVLLWPRHDRLRGSEEVCHLRGHHRTDQV